MLILWDFQIYIMYSVYIHPYPLTSLIHLLQAPSNFVRPLKNALGLPMSLEPSTGTQETFWGHTLKNTDLLFPRSHGLSISPQLRVVVMTFLFHAGMLTDLILHRRYSGSHSWVPKYCPVQRPALHSGSYNLSKVIPKSWDYIDVPEHVTNTYSRPVVHFDQCEFLC